MVTPINITAGNSSAPSLLKPLDPEKAKKAEETKARLQQALDAAKRAPNDINKQRKAMAAERIARIKEQLKSLRSMAAGADPKTIARMAKMLARELARAIKDYAAAGATTTEMQVASGDSATPAPSNEKSGDAVATDAAADTGDAAGGEEPSLWNASGASAYAQVQNLERPGQQASKSDLRTVHKKDDDSAFTQEARRVMEELRNLVKLQRLRSGPKQLFKRDDVSEAEAAIKDVERAYQSLTKAVAA